MNNKEYSDWYKEQRAEDAIREAKQVARKQERLAQLTAQYPEVAIDMSKARIVDFTDVHYQEDLSTYYLIAYYGAIKLPTDYGWTTNYIKERGDAYQVVAKQYTVYVISEIDSCLGATVDCFQPKNGSRIKGQRRNRVVHETSKGKYIELDGKRQYLK